MGGGHFKTNLHFFQNLQKEKSFLLWAVNHSCKIFEWKVRSGGQKPFLDDFWVILQDLKNTSETRQKTSKNGFFLPDHVFYPQFLHEWMTAHKKNNFFFLQILKKVKACLKMTTPDATQLVFA